MGRRVHVHDHPDRCVVGTVGEPGQRTFFLQARTGDRRNTVALEKEQAKVLAERMNALLDEMVTRGILPEHEADPALLPRDDDPLDAPIEEDFRVGALGLGWNAETSMLILEAHSASDDDTDVPDLESEADDGPDTVRVRLTGAAARAFAARALAVVAAGRPPCPFCQLPLDPSGHICPRANGYRR